MFLELYTYAYRKGVIMKKLEDYIRTIPDFPEPGIMFRDITTVFQDADGLQLAIDSMQELIKDLDFDVIVGAESRGFIYGAALAKAMAQLVEKLGGEVVDMLFMIELAGLNGRKFLEGYRVDSVLAFDGK